MRIQRHISTILGAVLLITGCHESPPLSPADVLSVRRESAHYIYLSSEGDAVDATWQETYHAWLLDQLDVNPGKVEYRKYRDRAHLRTVTGRNTNGFAEPGTARFHTIWPRDNHEVVHTVVMLTLGHPPALFNEGIAVALSTDPAAGVLEPRWNGRDLDDIAAERLRAGEIPALDRVLESRRFFDVGEETMYPLAGSFVHYLIQNHGWPGIKAYMGASDFDDSAARTRAAFLAVYGFSVDEAWSAWRASIGG